MVAVEAAVVAAVDHLGLTLVTSNAVQPLLTQVDHLVGCGVIYLANGLPARLFYQGVPVGEASPDGHSEQCSES